MISATRQEDCRLTATKNSITTSSSCVSQVSSDKINVSWKKENLGIREGVEVEKKKVRIRGHYRTFYFNSKMVQFIQKCKEKIFPFVRGGGGKRGLTRGLTRGLRRSLVKIF